MRHAALRSAHILTVSEFSKNDIANYYQLPPEKITVTYEAADAPRAMPSASDQVRTLQQYHIKPPYLLYIGNAYPHKNLELLISAMKVLRQQPTTAGPWQLVLVGREDYFYKRLHQLAWSQNVDDIVVFPGFVPDRQLATLYSQAFAYVFPSLYEGFGLPALEAMIHGAPVLAARSSCLPEILGDAATYFNPASVSDMIKQIHHLTDPVVRDQLVSAGRQRVRGYSWQQMAAATARVYEHVTTTSTS
jgi:glycosyltransferase involved in cell wall biosynthesis